MAKNRARRKASSKVPPPTSAGSSPAAKPRAGPKWESFRPWLEASDFLALVLYLAVVAVVVLPGIRHGIDPIHQLALLMSSVRILSGQVPYGDFYPWYGPLYHYFLALWVWMSGRDLLSIKLFLSLVSPLISMVLWIAAMRAFRLTWPARLFGVAAAAAWGMERLFHCGSTRSLLGLFFLGLWAQAIRAPARWKARLMVFPSILFAFFYSPEVGSYLVPAGLVFMVWDLAELEPARRKGPLLDYALGGAAALLCFILLYFGTTLTKTYLQFVNYASANMLWAYGRPKPSWNDLKNSPLGALYFLPLLMLVPAILGSALKLVRQQWREIPAWFPALIVFGGLLWNNTYSATSPDHLLFSLPPIMALMAWYFEGRTRYHWHQVALLLLIVWGAPFFRLSRLDASYWTNRFSSKTWPFTAPFGRIYLSPKAVEVFEELKRFSEAHPKETMVFPLHSFEPYWLGRPLLLPFDDLLWGNEPSRKKELMNRIIQAHPDYICLDMQFLYQSYMHEDIDELFDYIAGSYYPMQTIGPIIIYAQNPSPKEAAKLILELPGSATLDEQNEFRATIQTPQNFRNGYLQMKAKFFYRWGFLQRFSLPLVAFYLDGRLANWDYPYNGRERLRTTPEGGEIRLMVNAPVSEVKMSITFVGMMNAPPERVELSQARFYQFNSPPKIPYTLEFVK